jgi:GH24 family phage-related lysozyme (muramidase)
MTRAQLIASRLLWLRREKYRYLRWQRFVRTRPQGHPLRAKWFGLYQAAATARRHRDVQISRLPITHLDEDGVTFIVGEEGNLPYVYNDSQGHATVGVGHLIHYGNYTPADAQRWGTRAHPKYTPAEFLAFFRVDAHSYEKAVVKVWAKAPRQPTRNQFNADVSLAFNIGTGGFTSSTHARLIRSGAPAVEAAKSMLAWNQPPEIRGRRQCEHDLYLKGA